MVGITRANQLPNVSGSGGVDYQRNAFCSQWLNHGFAGYLAQLHRGLLEEISPRHRRRSRTVAATTYGRDVVQTTLISNIAIAYYALRQFDYRLDFSQRNVAADNDIVRINTVKYTGGDSAITDVYPANLLLQQAQVQVTSAQQSIAQTENQISILPGRNPGPIARGFALVDQPHLAAVPTGLPLALLERRPDVRQSEELLVAANANVGVAKAAYFPQISLTGQFGAQSTALTSFLQGPATVFSLSGEVAAVVRRRRVYECLQVAWAQRNESA